MAASKLASWHLRCYADLASAPHDAVAWTSCSRLFRGHATQQPGRALNSIATSSSSRQSCCKLRHSRPKAAGNPCEIALGSSAKPDGSLAPLTYDSRYLDIRCRDTVIRIVTVTANCDRIKVLLLQRRHGCLMSHCLASSLLLGFSDMGGRVASLVDVMLLSFASDNAKSLQCTTNPCDPYKFVPQNISMV